MSNSSSFVAPPSTLPDEWLATAHALADVARGVSMQAFRTPLDVQLKSDASPVTQADREAEMAMRELLARRHPDHGVVGEEYGGDQTLGPLVWYLDPIDGTKSYLCGLPLWGTLIALLQDGACVLGRKRGLKAALPVRPAMSTIRRPVPRL